MKFACGVVLYEPSIDHLYKMGVLCKEFDTILIWDNSKKNEKYIKEVEKYIYFFEGKNVGLAQPYNFFIDYCIENKFDFLCILDQDTMLVNEDISNIKKYIENNYSKQAVIYAPRLKGSKTSDWVINSNSFLNIDIINKENLRYDQFYFLDRMDADFCMQAQKKNLNIHIIENIVVDHKIGCGEKQEHSAMRHYYMFRNRIYYNFKFFPNIQALLLTLLQDMKHLFIIFKGEKNKAEKIRAVINGRKNYIKWKLENRKSEGI